MTHSRALAAVRTTLIPLLLLAFVGLLPGGAAGQEPEVALAGIPIEIRGELDGFRLQVEQRELQPGVAVATLRLRADSPQPPPRLELTWSIPARDVFGQWNSGGRFSRVISADWYPSRVESMLARNAPVMTLFGATDANRLTFAVSDALNAVELRTGLREEDARVYGTIVLFGERQRAQQEIALQVRFDTREVHFARALRDVSRWWAAMPGFEPAPVPDAAREPMYSTWYSYHQSVDAEALLREAEAAAALGYEAIIVDDGWQTLDSQRGYAYTGDWHPDRIPEMREFADAVHDHGMKLLLWYSLPLVGEESQTFTRFDGKYLRYWEGQGAWVLDPRYPEVRAHIIGTYRRAIEQWGIDGFKLDFLGFLVANDDTELTASDGRDYASVNEATDRLMTDIMDQLRELRPDLLIEFRQPYIGPLMRKYGNMFRAGDSPAAAVDNRVRTIDLRLLSGDTAVHSDMLMWHPREPTALAALQVLNVLFSVPQLSVRMQEIPEQHVEMVRHWTSFWRERRELLLDALFEPSAPMANYPRVAVHQGGHSLVALYDGGLATVEPGRGRDTIEIVNARLSSRVVLDTEVDRGPFEFVTFDTRGRQAGRGQVTLDAGAHVFEVPPAGRLRLDRIR